MSRSDDLVLECTQMIAAQGLAAFSLRKLADRVGIKAPSIYEHFASKELLLAAAHRSATERLGAALREAAKGRQPRQRLIATALGYLQFAEDQPALFGLLFMQTSSRRTDIETPPDQGSPYAFLLARVQDFLGDASADAEVLSFAIWALVHGAAVLRHTHLKSVQAPFVTGTKRSLEALLDGWAMR